LRRVVDHVARAALSGPLGRFSGLTLIFGGLALIVAATARFVRIGRLLDDPETHPAGSVRAELILSVVLALLVPCLTAYLGLG
jgi:putative membrane protein